jgi:hypothetical protein
MAEESNWRLDKIVQRVISIPGCEDVTVSETQIVNNRSATLLRLGAGREFQESFLYKDGDISIEFWALRFDGTEKRIMIDTYSVFLPQPYRIPGSRVPQSTIDRIKHDLDEALRFYPSFKRWPGSDRQPLPFPDINRVIFR